MSVATDVALEAFRRGGGFLGLGARALGFGKKAVKTVTSVFSRTTAQARPGIGSAVTKGPLKVGGKIVYGSKPGFGTAAKVASAVGAGGVGVATVASHRRSGLQKKPDTSPAPRPSRPSKKATSTRDKLCCPAGTKRKVCFKKDVDEAAEAKRRAKRRTQKARAIKRGRKSARGVSAKQKAARARFAKAARKGPIRKGTRL